MSETLANKLVSVAGRCSIEADRQTIIEATTALRASAPGSLAGEARRLAVALEQIVGRANQSSAGQTELLTKISDMHRIARYALLPLPAERSTASTDKPAAIEYRGIALAAHNRATPVAPDASTPVQRPHE